ncbi:MAG TPA: winged helix DNA-binding domain-containing protein [Patescibacteria group bacterium]|nr:winged helix DNA-binding domain-containing protein [Patescibacteria group bacterium]
MDPIASRLSNQRLLKNTLKNTHEVVSLFGAVQAQDYAMAKWSLAKRAGGATEESVEKDFNDGKILRTHVMRPTWHFVAPEDILWIQELTSDRVKALLAYYNRRVELTPELLKKTNSLLIKSLENKNFLTRGEIKKILDGVGITTDVQRLAHIVMWAELDGLICSGPRRGKNFTYALVSDRAPSTKRFSKDESLAKLALKYFTSHGPAQLKDFVWWSGLTTRDAQTALDSIKSKLEILTLDSKTYYSTRDLPTPKTQPLTPLLLSVYDEYFIGYTDRSLIYEKNDSFPAIGNALLTCLVFLDGRVVGKWKRVIKPKHVEIKIDLTANINKAQKEAIEQEAEKFANFIDLPAKIIF